MEGILPHYLGEGRERILKSEILEDISRIQISGSPPP
jgi:hypothetical protein